MRLSIRFAAVAAAVALVGSGLMTLVGPASPAAAISVCSSDNPPDWCFEPPPPPAASPAPTPISATAVLQTSVSMTWTNHATAGSSYTVQRVVNSAATTLTTSATTGWTDATAPAGTAISYRVFTHACNDSGCTDGLPATLNVTTHPLGTDPVGNAHGAFSPCYSYYGYTCPPFPASFSISGSALDFDTTSPIQVRLINDGVAGTVVTAQSTDTSNTLYPGYGNNHGFAFSWQSTSKVKGPHQTCVVAINVAGGTDKNIGCFSYTSPGPPAAASNLVLTVNPTNIAVTFTDNANDETGYYLQRSTDAGASWIEVASEHPAVSGSGTRVSVTDNSSGAGICYRILMENQYGQTPSPAACTS